jgi:hypothetical protein
MAKPHKKHEKEQPFLIKKYRKIAKEEQKYSKELKA